MTTDRVRPPPVSPSEAAARSRSNLIFAGLIFGASALAALAVALGAAFIGSDLVAAYAVVSRTPLPVFQAGP